MQGETRYARSGDISIAYQVVGDGPFDVVLAPGVLSHVELGWTVPVAARPRERLAKFSRLIVFDKRGVGMSDRVMGVPTLEDRMDDVRVVMDAAASARAAIIGTSGGAPMSLLFAATYPERTAALVLWGGMPRMMWAADYPWGISEERYRDLEKADERLFGSQHDSVELLVEWGRSREEAEALSELYRRSTSPGAMRATRRMDREIDVRHVLPAIRVPTLILHDPDDPVVPVEGSRYMAERIHGARLVEIPGAGHMMEGDAGYAVLDEVERFLNEIWASDAWVEEESDRVLATVLFTDIVGASERTADIGDRAWRDLLERHHALVRRQLIRFRGVEIDTAGDGFFASFDGPARAVRCASAIVEAMRGLGLDVRAGLHTGECEVVDRKVAGIAVHTGARVAAQAGPREVLVTSTVRDLVAGSGLAFRDRGQHELKGIPGDWRLYAVDAAATSVNEAS